MELKMGYKLTEVGVIPDDWEVREMEKLTSAIGDGIHTTPTYSESGDYYFINGNNLADGRITFTDATRRVGRDEFTRHKKDLDVSSILISINGTIGNIAFYNDEPVILGKSAAYLNVNNETNRSYLYYYLQTRRITEYFDNELTGSTIRNLGLGSIRKALVTLPFLYEQRAIAEALSDVDALLAKQDELIAKKRDMKQGAMQQLLTGKQRLPGFEGKWEVKKLGEVGSFSKGKGLPKEEMSTSGSMPAIPYTSIYTDFDEIIDPSQIRQFAKSSQNTVIINSPHLLIAGSSNMLENIGKATAYNDNADVAVGGDIILYKTDADVCFISYLLSTRPHRKRTIFLSQGSTIRHVYPSTFYGYDISLPSLPEQTAIAAVLSDMDAEIVGLEAKREKTRALKQGMMQELLTGRIRIKSEKLKS